VPASTSRSTSSVRRSGGSPTRCRSTSTSQRSPRCRRFESIPGNETNAPTPSTKVIYVPITSFGPKLGVNHLERDDELRNVDEPIMVLPEDYAPGWELEMRAYPDPLGFLLKGMLGAPVTTAGDGIITDPDTRRSRRPPPPRLDRALRARRASARRRSSGSRLQGPVGLPEAEGLRHRRAVDRLARLGRRRRSRPRARTLYIVRGCRPGADADVRVAHDPAVRALAPDDRHLARLDTETEDFNVAIQNPIDQVNSLGLASKFPDVMEKGDGPIVVSGSIPKRIIGTTDWDALVAGTPFAVKVRWQSTVVIARPPTSTRSGSRRQLPVRRRPAEPAAEPPPPRRRLLVQGTYGGTRRLEQVDARQRDASYA
jgi:hypothetical protein